jgi:aminoglycoside phosphotransferase (APT) family kinase protein
VTALPLDPDRWPSALSRWAEAHYGPHAAVDNVRPMPGNSGISFGFDVIITDDEGRRRADSLVIRLPPPGVARRGNTDVLRQVPLLQALQSEGVPVATVRWWGEEDGFFGVPYLVVDHIPGRSLSLFDPDPSFDLSPAGVEKLFRQALDALARIHRLDWRSRLPDWEAPRSIEAEMRAWEPIFAKALDPEWTERGLSLAKALLATAPVEPKPGLFHGDFYANNWMFDGGRLRAVIDWEIAGVGPSLVDLGWVCMMYDPDNWGGDHRAGLAWAPAVPAIVGWYEEAAGHPVPDADWYRAFAGYRFAAITALNVRLHRTGRRPDPTWDVFGASFPSLVDHSFELLA